MHIVILWCGFAGAWLLLAGPIYQANLELAAEQIERDKIAAAARAVGRPEPVQGWWWLVPPIAYLLRLARRERYHHQVTLVLEDEDYETLIAFVNKATGWIFVAGGAFLIALKETWELAEHSGWPWGVYAGVVAFMIALSLTNTLVRRLRTAGNAERRAQARSGA